jgi:tetratricopeptide (TPR) repeat protein
VNRDPNNFYALSALGEHRARQGAFSEAEALLVRAKSLAPGASPSGFTWGIDTALCFVLLNEGRLEEGARACEDRLAQAPSDPRAWLNLATIELRRGRLEQARFDAERALERKGRYAEAHFVRAAALAGLGRSPEARQEAERVLQLDPAHAGAKALADALGRP